MIKRISFSKPHLEGAEIRYVNEAFETNWVAPIGPNVDVFEELLAKYCSVKGALAVNSGTAAIHLALIMLGVGLGDEVIATSFTFAATVNPIRYLRATPIFVDSERESWNMCPNLLEEAIIDRLRKGSKPKAIIIVHLYGMPANMIEISKVAEKYNIPIIEDSAEALGSKYKEKPIGSFGKFSVLSFNGNKIITTSGGGALLSDDVGLIEQGRFLASQARDDAPHYQHSQIGYNYLLSNVLAGIGRGQMEYIDKRVQQKREIFQFYKNNMEGFEEVSFLEEPNEDYYSNYWLTAIILDTKASGLSNNGLRIAMEKNNIETRPLWKPLHLQPIFSKYPAYLNGVSQELFNTGLCLPSSTSITAGELDRVVDVFQEFVRGGYQ